MHVLYRNNRILFVNITSLNPKIFVLTLNEMFVILKYILIILLKPYLYILEMDAFAWKHSVIVYSEMTLMKKYLTTQIPVYVTLLKS